MFNLSNQQLPFDYSKPWYKPYIRDQLRINDSWYRPMNIICHVCKEKTFEARRLRKSGDVYTVTERNGREVRVGEIRVKDKFTVNQKPDGTFDALYCRVEYDGDKTPIPISIPHKDFIRRNILHYVPFFPHNEDCPDRYIVLAFFRELLDGDDIKFLQLPQHSGWQESEGKVLKKRLSEISKAIDTGRIHSMPETLAFFDETDPEQSKLRDRLEEIFDDLEGLNTYKQNWGEFLNSQKKIVVLSTSADGIRKSSQLIDMMIAGLYEYKQYDRDPRYTVILDEIEDLCLEKDGPVSIILRKGAKHRLSMLLASQEVSVEKDKLGKIIGNCGTLVFFRPKTDNITDISKLTGVDKSTLASLEQGQLIYHGLCYSKYAGKNKTVTLIGWTYNQNK